MSLASEAAAARWMARQGWQPFAFQCEVWRALAQGRSGLLHATTGSGKTYAIWLGILGASADHPDRRTAEPLRVLWLTPMRALAADTVRALQLPLQDLQPRWSLGLRTGDTRPAERARQDRRFPSALVTTPESLSLMLSRANARDELASVSHVVVDEWHELIGNKRGVQVQLALARLRSFNPSLVVWGLSATLGNLDEAMRTLCGDASGDRAPVLVRGRIDKSLQIDTLTPDNPGRYAWAGHLGSRMCDAVVREIEQSSTTLVFTNVRSQAEIWYQLLLQARPEWAGQIALHHGSLDKEVREWVELGLKQGTLRAVVATSSLDLGVDFLPVQRVLQIGSAKGVARLLQRAGRSGHAPGRSSRITLVPTHTLELIEAAAARRAAQAGHIESRVTPEQPLDVLVQHLVTIALGGGFEPQALYSEVCTAPAYRNLTRQAFDWALAFCEHGGASLSAYPDYHRLQRDARGIYRVVQRGIAQRHRLSIGTIVSDASMQVKWLTGGRIGTMEESFIARLRKGDCFVFAGRVLEFVRVQDMVAYVRRADGARGTVPTWAGSKMPLSTEMGQAVLQLMQVAAQGDFLEPELAAARPMLEVQMRRSRLPGPQRLLVECLQSREGMHLYVYPFAGRQVHLGLASLWAFRLARSQPNTFSLSVNDYGFELLAAEPMAVDAERLRALMNTDDLLADVLASLNSSELAQRRFREIARIAGLVFHGYPGAPKSVRQLQASSGLFFEVFRKYDPDNLLLGQAEREVLSQELDIAQLRATLRALTSREIDLVMLRQPTPLSLPLMVERFREKLSTEQLSARLDRIVRDMDRDLDQRLVP